MDVIKAYFDNFQSVIAKVVDTQSDKLMEGARKLAEAALGGHNLFAFGCSHAGLLALELYYRTGGMALINPVRAPGLCLDIDPATMTSQMERLPEYGKVIVDNQPLGAGDVIIIHSVSGRNTVTIDVAMRARMSSPLPAWKRLPRSSRVIPRARTCTRCPTWCWTIAAAWATAHSTSRA